MIDLDKALQIGNKIKIFYNKNNTNNRTVEIRGIIDNNYYVLRSFNKRKKMYNYFIESIYFFEFRNKDNILRLVK